MSAPTIFPPRSPRPTPDQISTNFAALLTFQSHALTHGKRPFTAHLTAPDNRTVLLTHFSLSHVEHAESSLARLAASHYAPAYLWRCTLYSTWEPCAMCAATIYWANIGRVVYAAGEGMLRGLTGAGNEENMTMDLGVREVLGRGQKDVEVLGPVEGWEARVVRESDVYWKRVRQRRGDGG